MGIGKFVGTLALIGVGALGGYMYENHNNRIETAKIAAMEAQRPYGIVETAGKVYVEDRLSDTKVKAESLFKSYAMLSDIVYNFQQMQSELDIPAKTDSADVKKRDLLEKILLKTE